VVASALGRRIQNICTARLLVNAFVNQEKQEAKKSALVNFYRNIHHIPENMRRDSAAGIAMTTGWTTEGSELESRQGKKCSPLRSVQTGSGLHPATCPMGTKGYFPGGNAARA
jgi:hypothetical protein